MRNMIAKHEHDKSLPALYAMYYSIVVKKENIKARNWAKHGQEKNQTTTKETKKKNESEKEGRG